ncbi:DegT/DnrJ/EryC1/StrS family aminotransferase [Mucilaginibacter sp.]|uniref:DegT/DnrJ/EryC1/StrS family aminotransferase n=1 Tax=Mucilaginibacter sp. TaxID=1882438 RepID=UPI0035BC56C5
MNHFKYPVYQPFLGGNEKKYVNECLDSTWISSKGKFINEFENSFANYIDVEYATTVSNGTVAIHLALLALGIGAGDEIIVPTLTYIASVNAITYTGAKAVFVDSTLDSWQIDAKDVKQKITPNTKAVMAVHLYGHPCPMDELVDICKQNGLFLIEDCAEAIGTTYKGKHVGTFGDISIFSFFGNKTITTGEGGMVVTNDHTLYDRSTHFKGQGLAKHREYWHDVVGYNYRMTNICAAIGLAQLEQIDTILAKKRQIADWYSKEFENTAITFHKEVGEVYHSYWMCSVLIQKSDSRDKIRQNMRNAGIETRPLFYPVHTMPMYSQRYERHINAEELGWRGINLPSYPALEKDDIKYIAQTMLQANDAANNLIAVWE